MVQILKASDVKDDYKPTKEELEKIRIKPDCFKLSGDGVFHTVQGEWNWIWQPTTFVRLQFCNLSCKFCDSYYTWLWSTKAFYSEPTDLPISELRLAVQKAQALWWLEREVLNITFTGGEPLLQQDKIIEFMQQNPDYTVQIETNGTISPKEYLMKHAKFNCSPKLWNSGHPWSKMVKEKAIKDLIETKDICFKFVANTPEDIYDIFKYYPMIPRHLIYIMPEGVTKEENTLVYERINDTILKEWLRTTPRLQNIMFDWAKRWV